MWVWLRALRSFDPLRFKITALTGQTDPEDFDEKDLLLAEAYDRLTAGEDPEKVQEDIIGRLRGENIEG